MANLYNNLTGVGRFKLQLDSIILALLAVLSLAGAAFYAVKRPAPQWGEEEPRARAARLLCSSFVCAMLAWLSATISHGNSAFARLVAASSGAAFFMYIAL